MVLPAPAQLPARVLAAMMAAEGLGEPHLALAPTATWRSADDPDPVHEEVAERVTALGWRGRGGVLEREVAASLAVLSQPAIAYYGWFTHDHATTAVLAAAIGREAVLAVRRPDSTVWLNTIPADRLAERLVAQAPDIPPGQGRSLTVSLAELHATGRSGQRRTAAGVRASRASRDVRDARQLLALPTTGAGELYVAIGRRHTEAPVSYADTTLGRYLEAAPRNGELSISPAGRDDLVAALHALRRRLST